MNPINLVLAAIVGLLACGGLCLAYSPEALERVGRRFRARSRGLIASREAYWRAHSKSYEDDMRRQKEQEEARDMFLQLIHGPEGPVE